MSQSNEPFVRHVGSPPGSSSTLSTSPRLTSLSRPHWPWTTHIHRPSSSSSSAPSITASPAVTSNMNWEAGSSTSTTAWSAVRQSAGSTNGSVAEETIRQWNFTAFEWTVRNVHALRDFVEKGHTYKSTDGPEEPHEVLRESPTLGDGKFKLEIVRTTNQDPDVSNRTPPHSSSPLVQQPVHAAQTNPSLSLCVTSLLLDLAHGPEFDVTATMFAGLKVQDDRGGERGARGEWVWEYWEKDWSFRQDSEVWECALPSLSSLLENSRIAETDSFVICIQIHNPVGPQYPQHPSAYYVPRDLLDGVEASLDNPHTGDVKFVCLERRPHPSDPSSPTTSTVSHGRRTSSETSGYSSTVNLHARKRVIYAHSDILMNRSEYFATMLTSAFSENPNAPAGERKLFEVVVEEADFVTMYWLLKWVYADWLLLKEIDDPRAAVDGMGEGWSAKWLSGRGDSGEWDWKIIGKAGIYDDVSMGSKDDDAVDRSVNSGESSTAGRSSQPVSKGKKSFKPPPNVPPTHPLPVPSSSGITSRATPSASGRRSGVGGVPTSTVSSRRALSHSSKSSPAGTGHTSPSTARGNLSAPSYNYPVSPRQSRNTQLHSTPDPHPHPTPPPPPASALSIWQVAHRYAMPGLSSLALSHMMSTLKPMNAFPLLLATCFWEDLHALVEDFVVDQWDVACNSPEFEQCCQEVAGGDWGAEGGKTLAALFRRLRSPNQR